MLEHPCKIWTGGKHGRGYGIAYHNGTRIYAHRLAYCQHNNVTVASIKGLEVRHRCDNPSCYEPSHLLLGTHGDNMKDMTDRNRQQKGSQKAASKLTEAQVTSMKFEFATGKTTKIALAKKYGVASMQVQHILRGVKWKHTEGPLEPKREKPAPRKQPKKQLFPTAAKGSLAKASKLTEAQVIDIRFDYAMGDVTMKQLAERFKVSFSNISMIITRKTWLHV